MKKLMFMLAFCMLVLQGCAATQLAGQAIRSAMKEIEFNVTNGYDIKQLKHARLAISTNASNESGQFLSILTGRKDSATATNVYTDMILNEFLKKGFDARSIADSFDANNPNDLAHWREAGVDVIVKANLMLDTSTSSWGAVTGGEFAYSGIKEFSLKGIDTSNGKIIFIATGEYGKAREGKDVAQDIAEAFDKQTK